MTELTVRRPKFQIDATVPLQWQPANPSFGLFGNTLTLLVIAFERSIISVIRQVMPRMTDPSITEEADAYYAPDLSAPFGGFNASGVGREYGREGLDEFVEVKSIAP